MPAQPLVAPGTYADTTGQAAKILELRNRALNGFSDPEISQRREGFVSGIEGTRMNAANDLQRRQTAGGVTGGIAFAQNQAVNNAALGARAGAERDLSLADMERRRSALNELEGTVGKERYGNIATSLAERQLAIQQAGQSQQGDFMRNYIAYLSQQGAGALPGDDRTGPTWSGGGGPNWSSPGGYANMAAVSGLPIPAGDPNAQSPNYRSPYTNPGSAAYAPSGGGNGGGVDSGPDTYSPNYDPNEFQLTGRRTY
jgi:hypothetical protein